MEDAIVPIADEVEPAGFFGKKPDDMTVGDTLVYSGVVVAACVAIPLAVMGAVAAGQSLWTKIRTKRREPKLKVIRTKNANTN